MTDLIQQKNKITRHSHAKEFSLNKEYFFDALMLVGYVLKNKTPIICDFACDAFIEKSTTNIRRLYRLNPFCAINSTYVEETTKLADVLSELSPAQENIFPLATRSLAFIGVIFSSIALARLISEIEEDLEDDRVVVVSKELLKGVEQEVHKAIIHATYMLTHNAPFTDRSVDIQSVKKTLMKYCLGDCELVQALNRSYPNTGLMHIVNMNHVIAQCLSKIS